MNPADLLKRVNQTRRNQCDPPYALILERDRSSIQVRCPWCGETHRHPRLRGEQNHYVERCSPPVEEAYGYLAKTEKQIVTTRRAQVKARDRLGAWKTGGQARLNDSRYKRRAAQRLAESRPKK